MLQYTSVMFKSFDTIGPNFSLIRILTHEIQSLEIWTIDDGETLVNFISLPRWLKPISARPSPNFFHWRQENYQIKHLI